MDNSTRKHVAEIIDLHTGDEPNGDHAPEIGGTPPTKWKPSIDAIIDVLSENEQLRGVFAFDEFRGRVVLKIRPPFVVGGSDFSSRPITDTDVTRTAAWIGRRYGAAPAHGVLQQAINVVADENGFDVLIEHLRSLTWDGVVRTDKWLTTYAGVKETEYSRAVGRALLLGAVGRGLFPGDKYDHVIVIESEQGAGKSSLVRLLGGEFAGDELGDLRDTDSKIRLRGCWVLELPELEVFERNKAAALKRFFTQTEDHYRVPYGRHARKIPRRTVFVGTTNSEKYLTDQSGNRRYLPIRAGKIDLDAFAHDRDQLIAEAVANCTPGSWVLSPQVERLAAIETAKRMVVDEFEERVRVLAKDLDETSTEAVRSALGCASRLQEKSETTRIGVILRGMGFKREQLTGGKRVYRRAKPGTEA